MIKRAFKKEQVLYFFVCIYQALSSMPALALFIEERGRFNRERSSGAYGTLAYFFAATIAAIPFQILVSVCFGSIAYWMVGMQPDITHFSKFVLMLFLVNLVGDALCLFVSSIVNAFSVANALGSVLLAFFLLFGGYFVSASNLPKYWKWANYISFFKYGFQALVVTEFTGLTFTCSDSQRNPFTGQCPIPNGEAVLEDMDFTNSLSFAQCAEYLMIIFICFKILNAIGLKYLNHEKR